MSYIPQGLLRPIVLWLVVVMAIYIFKKKDFGTIQRPLAIGTRERVLSVLIGGSIGFYDGLFGPGTGSFLIFLFIHYLTNIAALMFFVPTGRVLYEIAIPMAIFNMLGAYTGTRVAMKRGTAFIRGLFLFLLVVLILKLAYDMVKPA